MKKGQAAMEYLMTYGWAILIVIVVVAALYAMGVFRLGGTATPCSPCFGTQFALIDYADGILKLRSGSRSMKDLRFFTDPDPDILDTDNPDLSWTHGSISTISPGTTLTIGSSSQGFTSGTTYTLMLNYTDVDSGLAHWENATLAA